MKRTIFASTLALVFASIPALPATAQSSSLEGTESDRTIAVPPLGVPVTAHRGLWGDVDVGALFTAGSGQVSDAQPYLHLGVGYDLGERLSLGALVAYSASSGACYADICDVSTGDLANGAESFSMVLVNAFFGYLHPLKPQWFLGAKVTGGLSLLTPEPEVAAGTDPSGLAMGFNGGLLLSTELHTYLNHFVIGADVGGQYVMAGSVAFPAITIAARFKYVF